MPSVPSKAKCLRTLRKLHAWIGLSGAAFGLLFGFTGIFLNHRAVWKLKAGTTQERKAQIELAEPAPSPEALAQELAQRFGFKPEQAKTKIQKGRPAEMGGVEVRVAETWTVQLKGYAHHGKASYTPGNRSVDVDLRDASLLTALIRLHMAGADELWWILLSDAFAGSMIFLTLTGILLWTRLAGSKLLAAGLALGGLLAIVLVASRAW